MIGVIIGLDTLKFENEVTLGETSSIQTTRMITTGLFFEWSTHEYKFFYFKGVCSRAMTSHNTHIH